MNDNPDSLRIDVSGRPGELNLAEVFGKRPACVDLDIGCGKGGFLVARALAHPGTCFIGIDKKQSRIMKVERKALRAGATNIRLIRAEAEDIVSRLLPPCSLSACYLFFPDPWPKRRHHHRRLFDASFTDSLARTLAARGTIHVATDHAEYFEGISGILFSDPRFAPAPPFAPGDGERTEFELVFNGLNAPIHSCSFEKIGQDSAGERQADRLY